MADTVTPRTYIYGILIFMFIIVGGVSIFSEFYNADSSFDNASRIGEFNRTFNKLNDVSSQINTMKGNIENAESDFGAFGVLNALISSSWQSIRLMFSSFSFMNSVFGGLERIFGVPGWIPAIIILFISVTLIFAIYRMIFQTE